MCRGRAETSNCSEVSHHFSRILSVHPCHVSCLSLALPAFFYPLDGIVKAQFRFVVLWIADMIDTLFAWPVLGSWLLFKSASESLTI